MAKRLPTHKPLRLMIPALPRPSAHQRGYGDAWRRLRRLVLSQEPLCRHCLRRGHLTPATDVDHIVAKSKGGTDARDNLQSLCHSCHSRKTALEDGAFGHA